MNRISGRGLVKFSHAAAVASLLLMNSTHPILAVEEPAGRCDMSQITKDFAKQVADDAEKRRVATAERVGHMTERVLNEIRTKGATVEGLEAAVEQLRTDFAIRPEDSKSEILTASVGTLQTYGKTTSAVLKEAIDLGERVGALKIMGGKDGAVVKLLKHVPFLGQHIQTAQERAQSGQEAINNLNAVVDAQVVEIRGVDKMTKKDEMNWRQEFETLWNKADDLAHVREAVKQTSESLDGLTAVQKRAYEQFIDELETAELIYRDLAESLQQQVLMNITVQKSLKETQKVLQTKSKADLRKLAALLANIAAQDTAIKGQELAAQIEQGVTKAEKKISEDLANSTKQMTELLKGIGDRTKLEEARAQRRAAAQSWKEYDAEIRGIRDQRNTELKKAYEAGNVEILDHEVAAKTMAAVVLDPKAATAEAPAKEEAAKPSFNAMPK